MKGLRKAGAKSLAEANRYLEDVFLPQWQKRFRREPVSEVDAHRPLGERQDLDSTLSHVESRRVLNNYTVSWEGKPYQIPREAVRPGLRSSSVRVEGRLDGTVWARIGGQAVLLRRCERALPELNPKAPVEVRKDHNRGGRSNWMKTFDLKKAPPVWVVVQAARRVG